MWEGITPINSRKILSKLSASVRWKIKIRVDDSRQCRIAGRGHCHLDRTSREEIVTGRKGWPHMFNKVKQKIGEQIDEFQQKREEQKRLEKAAAEAKVRAERERIRLEKEALMALSDKALMVEAVMALRNLNSRLDTLETQQADLKSQIESLKWDVDMLPREEK